MPLMSSIENDKILINEEKKMFSKNGNFLAICHCYDSELPIDGNLSFSCK